MTQGVTKNLSIPTQIARGKNVRKNREFWVLHQTAGMEVAGSGLRELPECYRVCTMIDGRRWSEQFPTINMALEDFVWKLIN